MQTIDPLIGAAQGDLTILPCAFALPATVEALPLQPDESAIVAHSKTGHHHIAVGTVRYWRPTTRAAMEELVSDLDDDIDPESGLVACLEVLSEVAELVHLRQHDTHETLRLPKGIYPLLRQREYSPEGWRRVED